MFQSLLVPLDGSAYSERSLGVARTLARPGAALHLAHVHVAHPPDGLLSNTQFHFEGLDMAEYDGKDRANEKAYLREVEARMGGDGFAVDSTLLEGPVAEEVATYATRVGADLVLITTHGRQGAKRMWLGSVADALLHLTHLPLLVLHPPPGGEIPVQPGEFRHVLVALDGSELSASILDSATDLAEGSGAKLTLAHAVTSVGGFVGRFMPMRADQLATALEKAEAYLEFEAEDLRKKGFEVEVCVEAHDDAATGITRMAEHVGADVIALATHGHGGLRRALAGSVADAVLHKSHLPLLVQRPLG